MALSYSEARWPLLEISVGSRFTEVDAKELLRHMSRVVARGERHVLVAEAHATQLPESGALRMLAPWIRAHQQEIASLNRGTAIVVSSPLARGALRAALHLFALSLELTVFETPEEAHAWARTRIARIAPSNSV